MPLESVEELNINLKETPECQKLKTSNIQERRDVEKPPAIVKEKESSDNRDHSVIKTNGSDYMNINIDLKRKISLTNGRKLSSDADDSDIVNDPDESELCELTHNQQSKVEEMTSLLSNKYIDVSVFQKLAAAEDGFVTDEIRQQIWPKLLLIKEKDDISILNRNQASQHKSFNQVVLDVERTLKRFPPGISAPKRKILMDQLTRIIITVLERNPAMHYYQGYHDVGITFLLVCGEDSAVKLLEEISLTHLREFLQPTMERTVRWLAFLYPILKHINPAVYKHMVKSCVGTTFCLAWLITWYAHTLSQYRQVVRLYDFLLASPPLMPMYVAGLILNHREAELLATECDMAMMHCTLSQVPDTLPLDELLEEARLLYKKLPPPAIADEVDTYIEEQKKKEERERQEIKRRAKFYKNKNSSSFYGRIVAYVPIQRVTTVAFVSVLVGVAAFIYRNNNSKLLPLSWY